MAEDREEGRSISDWLTDRILRIVIGMLLVVPYRWRVPAMGWLMRRIFAPLAGYNKRSEKHLRLLMPELSEEERQRIVRQVADNAGRTFMENYSTREFLSRNAEAEIFGPGLKALETAAQEGRAVILASGHLGNYEAPRAALVSKGYDIGGLYRPAANRFFNDHYKETMEAYGGPIFAQGRKGTAGFVRHLKDGGMLVLLFDQRMPRGAMIPFMGRPAPTATSAADLALRYNAVLIPFFGIRKENGLDFRIELDAPIAHSNAKQMMTELTQALEKRVRAYPGQWFWVHRRWGKLDA